MRGQGPRHFFRCSPDICKSSGYKNRDKKDITASYGSYVFLGAEYRPEMLPFFLTASQARLQYQFYENRHNNTDLPDRLGG